GKSTIINLLYRFWDVDRGEISIDGINIKDINLKSLRKNITVVTQDLLMFDDTIRNNIIVDSNKNSVSLEKICEIVDLDKFIYSLEDGLDTVIGEKGAKISGGQKQRIALARALASDNKVLILDEATSALDNISQQKILENIYQYADDKIVIVIAHRMSTIQDADMIYVFDNGKVVEEGRADELVKNGGIYKKLVSVNI
ncbi:MAG: ATP-binding cassette domain-containing protein, partial [Clostridioides sp.]|nr:ATP-binding cassette domain-containing protein [Clostridioides sp.]